MTFLFTIVVVVAELLIKRFALTNGEAISSVFIPLCISFKSFFALFLADCKLANLLLKALCLIALLLSEKKDKLILEASIEILKIKNTLVLYTWDIYYLSNLLNYLQEACLKSNFEPLKYLP